MTPEEEMDDMIQTIERELEYESEHGKAEAEVKGELMETKEVKQKEITNVYGPALASIMSAITKSQKALMMMQFNKDKAEEISKPVVLEIQKICSELPPL